MIRKSLALLAVSLVLGGCTTNEATGRSQFTGLMNTQAENQMGSQEQQKVVQQFGELNDAQMQAYVDQICARLQPVLERTDVQYTCTVLDSPVVNAFALPGGYININRGLIAYANNEAELASVIAHEMGHVTARHISERYSQSALTQLGGTALSVALGSTIANQAISMGSNMFLATYSRSQESEADDLGIRYLNKAGYDPMAMAGFLSNLQRESSLEALEQGQEYKEMSSFMSTHPMTSDRIARANAMAANIPAKATETGTDRLMRAVNGLVYGDSAKDGYVRGTEFLHPDMGFAFMVPTNFTTKNAASQVVATSRSGTGAAFIFDGAGKAANQNISDYMTQTWTEGKKLDGLQTMNVNGMNAVTAQIQGSINNKPALMRLVAIEWSTTQVFRFQFAMPQATTPDEIEAMKNVSYSLRRLNANERNAANPKRIAVFPAGAGDTVQSMASRMAFTDGLNEKRFRALNGLNAGDGLVTGRAYKIVTQ